MTKLILLVLLSISFLIGCNNNSNVSSNSADSTSIKSNGDEQNEIPFDLSVLNVTDSITISKDQIEQRTIDLDIEIPVFPVDSELILNELLLYNTVIKKVIDTFNSNLYIEKIVQFTQKGFSPEEILFMSNNSGKIKVVCNDMEGLDLFTESNLFPLNKPKTRILKNKMKLTGNLRINQIDEIYKDLLNNQFLVNDTLYNEIDHLQTVLEVYDEKNFIYKCILTSGAIVFEWRNGKKLNVIQKQSSEFCNSNIFPINNKILFRQSLDLNTEAFIAFDVMTCTAKKYIVPLNVGNEYYCKDGIYFNYFYNNENSLDVKKYHYSFIKY